MSEALRMPWTPGRVLFVTSGLRLGGAETQLLTLLRALRDRGIVASLLVMDRSGGRSADARKLGIVVHHLNLTDPRQWPQAIIGLPRIAGMGSFDVIHGWMYHGCVLATALARLGMGRRCIWSIRHSVAENGVVGPAHTRFAIRAARHLSACCDGIVFNSEASRAAHRAAGFRPRVDFVIRNAFDGAVWSPDNDARTRVRRELGLSYDRPLIGLVARFDPIKGHEVFLRAAASLARTRPDAIFLLVGSGTDPSSVPLRRLVELQGLSNRVLALGVRSDIPSLTAALDIACCCSWQESSANTVVEALLCGVPVVSTDVGDVRERVVDPGLVVPAGDHIGLAKRCLHLLSLPSDQRRRVALECRNRLLEDSSPSQVAERYLSVYSSVDSGNSRPDFR